MRKFMITAVAALGVTAFSSAAYAGSGCIYGDHSTKDTKETVVIGS